MERESQPGKDKLGLLRVACTVAVVFLVAYTLSLNAFRQYVGLQRFNARNPPPAAEVSRRSLFFDLDAYLWNTFALEVAEGRAWRVRWTQFDNYPRGREVMWSTGYVWLLAASGAAWRSVSGDDLQTSIERASILVNPALLILFLIVLAAVVQRRLSWGAAILLTLSIAGYEGIAGNFLAGRPDHHGLASMAAVGTLLCLLLGGMGFVAEPAGAVESAAQPGFRFPDERRARRWFSASGICAGVGMWVSALSLAPVLAAVGLSAIAGVVAAGKPGDGRAGYRAALWKHWGVVGAGTAFLFYLLEFFPSHLGLRLEVNHPLYQLSWLGGSWLLADSCSAIAERRRPRRTEWPRLMLAALAVALLPLAIAFGGSTVYRPSDPELWRWHQNIFEFQPYAWKDLAKDYSVEIAVWVLAVLLLLSGRQRREVRGLAVSALALSVLPLALVLWQSRWMNTFAATLALGPLAALVAASEFPSAVARRVPALLLGCVLLGNFAYASYHRLTESYDFAAMRQADPWLLASMAARDAAEYLRAVEGERPIVLMSSPWPDVVMSYMGGFRAVGSLYWENIDGLRAVSEFFATDDEETARRIARERGVTHVAIVLSDFGVGNFYWIRHGGVDEQGQARAFGNRFLSGHLPAWLSEVPYVPGQAMFRNSPGMYGVRLYRVHSDMLAANG